ncbi:hypothetical protein [Arcobacter sp.]|uniref:hypothetical protein n=1 Tax=Arcobacter sp. TaxID=1872629 RepID=UPI003D1466CD
MKKIFLVLSMVYSCSLFAQSDNLAGMCSKIVKDAKYKYCLQIGSKTVIHLFDVLPKMRDYGYTGDAAYNAPSNSHTIFYPTYQNSRQEYELTQYLKANKKSGEMIVTITDLDLADIIGKEKINESKVTMQKQFATLGIKISKEIEEIIYEPNRIKRIESIKMQYNAAKKINADYIPSEGMGMISITLDNFENAFIHYSDFDKVATFSASYANKYLFSITVKHVDKYKSCSTVMAYLLPYLSEVKLDSLDRNIYFK